MHVAGHFEGSEVAVTTVWTPNGDGRHTCFELTARDVAPESRCFVWADGSYLRGAASDLPKKARSLLDALFAHVRSLTVETDRIVLWDDRVPIVDHAPLVHRLEQLVALAAALRGSGGPYR